jgi:lipopolysaccharide/colanic/teichoic acid biosynthesis glycosyltransferase
VELIHSSTVASHAHAPSRSAILSHGTMQIAVTLLFGIAIPILVYSLTFPSAMRVRDVAELTIALSAGATIASVIVSTRMIRYPGVSHAGTILPAFGSSYSVVLAVLLLLREPYSNALLFLCFSGSIAVQFAISALLRQTANPLHYVVPGGRVSAIAKVRGCNSNMWSTPDTPLPRGALVVADLHFDHNDEWERRIAKAALDGVPIFHYKQVVESLTGRVQIDHLSENVLGSLIPSNSYHGIKRTVDLLFALVILPILAPLLLVAAIAIKLDSPGPVFFRQERVGFRAKRFKVLKFRTMRALNEGDNSRDVQAAMTADGDSRVTKVGKWLRRSRIDELPQIWNILCGDMSWIGPRPEALSLSEWYAGEIPFYAYRHIVRPGISGWAQVNQGHVTDLEDVHTKLQYDFFYVKHFSYWIDIIIAVRTVAVVFNGFGAR